MRDTTFSILKALAIIMVVLSHAGVPGWLGNVLYLVHVPAFFLCAGYFFNTRYLHDERTYLVHRIKGLYWPFVRYSLFFLLVHNLFFACGLLSEHYGNAAGGVLHPYNWHQFCQHAWSIVFNMSGYDEFLCGAYWFFRALLLASIAYLVLFKLFSRSRHLLGERQTAWAILITALLLIVWKICESLNATGIPQGGYREMMGVAFMAMGFLMRQYSVLSRINWKWALGALAVLIPCSIYLPSSMTWRPTLVQFLTLPVPAVCGFVLLHYVSRLIGRREGNIVARSFIYIGDRTLYIFAFHLLAFKAAGALKVAYYGLPWEALGGHPYVISPENNFLFILLYLLCGVGLPLLWLAGYELVRRRVHLTEEQALGLAIVCGKKLCHLLLLLAKGFVTLIRITIRGIKQGIKDIIAASSTKVE